MSTTPHAPRWGLRIAAQSSRTVGVDVFAYDHALGMPADERTGVEPGSGYGFSASLYTSVEGEQ